MKKILITTLIIIFFGFSFVLAENNFSSNLSGKILLQVESVGEAWYLNPSDLKRYFLGRPSDAFDLMRNLSIGISNTNLEKIPIGIVKTQNFASEQDSDNDGLSNDLENALGTNLRNKDSDNDGYEDKTEILNSYNPTGVGKLNINNDFTKNNLGKIFLQVEKDGQAWYINPEDEKRYFLNRPRDAWDIMRKLSLGITDENLNIISIGNLLPQNPIPSPTPNPTPNPSPTPNPTPDPPLIPSTKNAVYDTASAIRSGNIDSALNYFTPELRKAAEYSLNFLDDESKLLFANILSDAKLSSSSDTQKIYSTEVYFSMGGHNATQTIILEKQEDGEWLISSM